MPNNIAIVAAGGFASRINSPCPKSLLKIKEIEILHHVLNELNTISFRQIIVYTNRTDYCASYDTLVSRFSNVKLEFDCGYESTFEILRHYHNMSPFDIFFTYGHSVNSKNFYQKLLQSGSLIGCSLYAKSSKSKTYSPINAYFAEPPYFIPTEYLNLGSFNNWQHFLSSHQDNCQYLYSDFPNEFNFKHEFDLLENKICHLGKTESRQYSFMRVRA